MTDDATGTERSLRRCDGGRSTDTPRTDDEAPVAARRAAAVVDCVDVPVVEYAMDDGTGVVRLANDAFRETFDADVAAGDSLDAVLEAPSDDGLAELTDGTERFEGDVSRRTRDGWRTFLLRVVPLSGADRDGQGGRIATYSDLPIRRAYDRKLESLHEATRALISQDTTVAVAESAVDAAVDILGIQATSVHLYDEERDVLPPVATTDRVREVLGDMPDLPIEGSLAGQVYESGEPVLYDDPTDYPGVYNPDTPLKSELILPLGDHGVLISGSTEPAAFSDAHVSLVTILASNTEAALDRIEREETLADRERALAKQNERLEAFASMVSHDLRNPLNVAMGRLEFVREDCDTDHVEPIGDALERMNDLVHDLLELARHGDDLGSVETVDLAALARESWSHVQTEAASLAVADDLGTVSADRSRLAACFENLFRNAIQHGTGDVRIRVGATDRGFFVADDGPGIPAEERDDVLEVGYSTANDGTGMGLAIVDEVASAHGWSVSVGESADGGARFEFSVADPAVGDDAGAVDGAGD